MRPLRLLGGEALVSLHAGWQLVRTGREHLLHRHSAHRLEQDCEALRRYRVISFDVFDTLVRRKVEPPEYVQRSVAGYISRMAQVGSGRAIPPAEVQHRRGEHERRLRRQALAAGYDSECRHQDLLAALLGDVLGRPASAEELAAVQSFELRMEGRVLAENPASVALLAAARAAGRRVIAISDMYLSEGQVSALLEGVGLLGKLDAVYVSSDYLLCKGTGRLFSRVLQAEGIAPGEMLHIGDNPYSDLAAARAAGIAAMCCHTLSERARRTGVAYHLGRAHLGARAPTRVLADMATAFAPPAPPAGGDTDEGVLYGLGRDLLGPAFCFYVHHVLHRADQLGLDHLGFVARDGYLLEQVGQVLRDRLHPLRRPDVSYLHLSRLSTSLPALAGPGGPGGLGPLEARRVLRTKDNQGLRSLLTGYNLCDDEMLALALRAGFTGDPCAPIPDPAGSPALQRLFSDRPFQQAVAARALAARRRLLGYLDHKGLLRGGRVALLDVGWSGTVQDNLQQVVAGVSGAPELWGIYLGLYDNAPRRPDQNPGSAPPGIARKEGVLYDYRRSAGLREWAPLHFVEIFEQATRAFHGTTVDYAEEGFAPLLREEGPDREAERRAEPWIALIQRGVLDFAATYGSYAEVCDLPGEEVRRHLQRELERLIFVPTRRELAALAHLTHSDDWGQRSHGGLVSQTGPLALLRPGAWIEEFYRSYWKPGYLARTGGPLLCHLYHLYEGVKLLSPAHRRKSGG